MRDPLPLEYRVRLEALRVAVDSRDRTDSAKDVIERADLFAHYVGEGQKEEK